jgi:hypothetical protein
MNKSIRIDKFNNRLLNLLKITCQHAGYRKLHIHCFVYHNRVLVIRNNK